ncbi:hypothetical protein DVH24_015473 [Malus domestica]|uniref:Uncharacterized protein n=1 Tax=Malus domestica TaxID=3750 RepID=A0A498HNW3_MALDO|nr:hypothetical protein DVH24_015473 [Malus domestica]
MSKYIFINLVHYITFRDSFTCPFVFVFVESHEIQDSS